MGVDFYNCSNCKEIFDSNNLILLVCEHWFCYECFKKHKKIYVEYDMSNDIYVPCKKTVEDSEPYIKKCRKCLKYELKEKEKIINVKI